MSKLQILRVWVNERLTAAAEEIFELFERTIAEYEEELCRSEQENQRKQRLLDQVDPRVLRPCAVAEVQIPSPSSPEPGLNQDITDTLQIKEELEDQSFVKQEEEQQPVSLLPCATYVMKEESSLLQTQNEELSSEPHFFPETEEHTEHSPEMDNDEDWRLPLRWSVAQMETAADGDHGNQVQTRDGSNGAQNSGQSPEYKCVPETSVTVNDEDTSGTDEEPEKKKRQCPLCKKTFRCNRSLQIHIRVHTGERPYSCPICHKNLTQKGKLQIHMRTHNNVKPYSCSICQKSFTRKDSLDTHTRIHTGEKPYSCPLCGKVFNQSSNLKKHIKTHSRPHTSQS